MLLTCGLDGERMFDTWFIPLGPGIGLGKCLDKQYNGEEDTYTCLHGYVFTIEYCTYLSSLSHGVESTDCHLIYHPYICIVVTLFLHLSTIGK